MFYDIVPPIIGVKDLQSENCCKLSVTTRLRKQALTLPFLVCLGNFFPRSNHLPGGRKRCRVFFPCVNEIEALFERPRVHVNVKVFR